MLRFPGLSLPSPFLSLGQVEALRKGEYPHADELPLAELACVFSPEQTLTQALDDLCMQAIELVRERGRHPAADRSRCAAAEIASDSDGDGDGGGPSGAGDAGLRTLPGLRSRPATAATFIMRRC